MTDAVDRGVAAETVSLYVTHHASLDLARGRAAFADLDWLGEPVGPTPGAGWQRIASDLELPVRDGSGPAVRKAAHIDVGSIRESDGRLDVLIAWRSASLAPLFPVFAGHLEITRSGLTLVGDYAPPLGTVGLLLDQGILHFVAVRTAQAFLTRVVRELGEPSDDGPDEAQPIASPASDRLRTR